MPNEEKIVVGNDVTPDMMARIKSMKGEETDDGIVFEQPEQTQDDLDVNINLDEPQEPDTPADEGHIEGSDDGSGEGESGLPEEFQSFLKDKGVEDQDEYLDKLFRNRTFKVKMGGKDKELPYSEIKSVLARGTTFQKKYNEMENSEEYRFGVLMKAAEGGNAEAQKAIQQKLMEFTGTESGDDMLDKLEDVDGEYDLDAEMKAKKDDTSEDDHFSDVKDSVDYQQNLDIIQNDMKDFMPPKIWKAFWEAPEDRRAMYNLAATGKVNEINDLFQSHLQSLPLEKQLEIESDPELYGRSFITVTNRVLNGQKAKQGKENSDPDTQLASQVSDGSRGRTTRTKGQSVPDFTKMSSQEFREWQVKNGLYQ